ncbi:MAG: LysR family transcriptional regulator [Pseudomonadota bacterium]
MSIRALRTLIAIHQHGSFRAAAEAERLTPSAVSHQMRTLEETWQLALFDRSHKSPTLTQTGLMLVGEAVAVVAAYDGLAAKVRAQDDLVGDLTLGAVPTTLTGLVPAGLAKLKDSHPGLRVRIVPGLTHQLLLHLDRGQVHAAIVTRPDVLPKTLTCDEIVSEELVMLVSEDTVDLPPKALLTTQPFIRFSRDAVVGRQIEAWLQRHRIDVHDAMELEGLEAISSMVAAGLGVSIVPSSTLTNGSHLPLRKIPLADDGPRRVVGLVRHAASPRSRMVGAVTQALRDAAREQHGAATG